MKGTICDTSAEVVFTESDIPETVTVEMSVGDAKMFKEFQRDYDKVKAMSLGGVFNVRNGSAVLNFDKDGELCAINIKLLTFKK